MIYYSIYLYLVFLLLCRFPASCFFPSQFASSARQKSIFIPPLAHLMRRNCLLSTVCFQKSFQSQEVQVLSGDNQPSQLGPSTPWTTAFLTRQSLEMKEWILTILLLEPVLASLPHKLCSFGIPYEPASKLASQLPTVACQRSKACTESSAIRCVNLKHVTIPNW